MPNQNKKLPLKTIIFIGIIILLILYIYNTYNKMIEYQINVEKSWAQVENQLQRRYDLIPNLVETVKGAVKSEKEILTEVIKARSEITGAKTVKEKISANSKLDTALSRLLVIVERYPEIKSNEKFSSLMIQLEGTENRIAVERKRYNDAVADYNRLIRKFPNVIIARLFNFQPAEFYKVSEEAKKNPKVEF